MSKILILYATRHSQTARIAERIATRLANRGAAVTTADARDRARTAGISLAGLDAVLLASSVHGGRHHPEMLAFVRRHREDLGRIPAIFVSVSNSQAGVEDEARPEAKRTRAAKYVRAALDRFVEQTGWHPTRMVPIAGALRYRAYGPFLRLVMKLIARSSGAPTDTSRDHDLTDWAAVDELADELGQLARPDPLREHAAAAS